MEMRLLLVADVLGTLPFSPAYQSILLIMILSTNPNDLYISRFTVIVIAGLRTNKQGLRPNDLIIQPATLCEAVTLRAHVDTSDSFSRFIRTPLRQNVKRRRSNKEALLKEECGGKKGTQKAQLIFHQMLRLGIGGLVGW
jgi:hypothetical protein